MTHTEAKTHKRLITRASNAVLCKILTAALRQIVLMWDALTVSSPPILKIMISLIPACSTPITGGRQPLPLMLLTTKSTPQMSTLSNPDRQGRRRQVCAGD